MERVWEEELDYPGDDGLYYFGGEPFTGVAVSYDGPRIQAEVEYWDGVGWGVSRTWHASGAPASEKQCAGGVFHGLCMEWDEAGRLTLYEVYEQGICVWRRHWEAEQLVEECGWRRRIGTTGRCRCCASTTCRGCASWGRGNRTVGDRGGFVQVRQGRSGDRRVLGRAATDGPTRGGCWLEFELTAEKRTVGPRPQ